jgi:hypothetical protein
MAKNKGKYHSKTGAEEAPVEQLQSFTSRAYFFLRPHALKLFAVIGGVAVVLVGFSVYSWWDTKRESQATKLFGEVTRILEARVEEEKPEKPDEPPPPEKQDDKLTYPTVKARSEAALGVLERLERDYSGTDVSDQGRLVKAGLLFDLGRHDEAIGIYRSIVDGGKAGELRFLAAEGLGYAFEAKGDLDGALQAFQKLQPDEKGFYRDVSLYHQARVLAAKGDKAGALALYKQILEKWPQSSLKNDVTNRVAVLEQG